MKKPHINAAIGLQENSVLVSVDGISIFDYVIIIAVKNHYAIASGEQRHELFLDLYLQIADKAFRVVELVY